MMTRYNWAAVVLFSAIFISSFIQSDNAGLFFNGVGLLVVISGTLGAMFLSYASADIIDSLRVAKNALSSRTSTPDEIVNTLIQLAVDSRRRGNLAFEDAENQTSITFLKRALGMMVDGYKPEELRDVLYTETHYFQQRRLKHERLFRHAARLAPAFGVAGSVIGLIAMLSGIGDPEVIMRSIPIALTSTLYGIVLGNFVLTPVAENIYAKTQHEIMLQRLATDGVIAIQHEQNPYRLVKKLESFLTPSERSENEQSFEELKQRIKELKLNEAKV